MQPTSLETLKHNCVKEIPVHNAVDLISGINAEVIKKMSESLLEWASCIIHVDACRTGEFYNFTSLVLPQIEKIISDAFATPIRFIEEGHQILLSNKDQKGLLDSINDDTLIERLKWHKKLPYKFEL